MDGQVTAEMVWVRATEILMLAQARLADCTHEPSQRLAVSLDSNIKPDHRATTKPWPE